MALTHSTMLALGTTIPDFQLPDVVSGEMIRLDQFAEQNGLLVMFICRHCPYVVHVQQELGRLGRDYAGQSLGVLAISSNDVDNYPDDHPDRLRAMAQELEFTFPTVTTKARPWPRPSPRPVPRISFYSTRRKSWSTGGSWMRAVRGTASR